MLNTVDNVVINNSGRRNGGGVGGERGINSGDVVVELRLRLRMNEMVCMKVRP